MKNNQKIKLMTHVIIGYPSLEATVNLAKAMVESGADIVELQIPFSDPLADGATIMKACEKSLENGTRVKDAFSVMKKLSQEVSIPLIFMSYYNIVFKYGVEKFCKDAKEAGAKGIIIPDIPLEEENQEHYIELCKKYNLNDIRVISPSSTDERLKKNAKIASGFVYFTSREGTTGASANLEYNLVKNIERIKKYFKIPIAVGFGISKRDHIQALRGHADIAVIGSAIIDVINKSDEKKMTANVKAFIKGLVMVK